MATLEPLDEPEIKTMAKSKKQTKKRHHGSTNFFIFVDYLFIFIFFLFLCYMVLYMIGVM